MTDFSVLEGSLGYVFKDKNLLETALTHSSYAHEHKCEDYERLEFLGDAVLDYALALLLYEHFPNKKEGEMTKIRAALAKEDTLSEVADTLELTKYLRLSQGTQTHPILNSKAVKCDLFESVIGAVLLDSDKDMDLIINLISKLLKQYLDRDYTDYKSLLLEIFAKSNISYSFNTESNNDMKDPFYTSVLYVNNIPAAKGQGKTKKNAESQACKEFYKKKF